MNKKVLLSSILVIALCASLIVGSTFALFTSESKVDISVTAGKVEMVASIEDMQTWSLEDDKAAAGRTDGTFTQGGTAVFDGAALTLTNIIPGDKVSFNITGTNNSNVKVQYRYKLVCLDGQKLMEGLVVTVDGEAYTALSSYTSAWATLDAGTDMADVTVSVELPEEAGNEYQTKVSNLAITVEAVQGNATVTGAKEVIQFDIWSGETDDEGLTENTDTAAQTLAIETAEQLAAFAAAVNGGNTYAGYTVTLENDLYLEGMTWTPIGPNADAANKFRGTFDGQNHTIYGLTVNQGAGYHAAGLFGALNGTLKNLVIDGASVTSLSSGSATDNGTAVVAGSIYTTGAIDNVKVLNSTVNGNRYVGGIVGYCYGSVTNCVVENTTVVGTMDDLSGALDNGDKVGGIAGYVGTDSTAGNVINNNTVSGCTISAARDVGGIAGVISGLGALENNAVSDTDLTYSLDKDYEEAGAIVSQRTAWTVSATNVATNVTITKN